MTAHEDDGRWADEVFDRARGVAGGEPGWRADVASVAAARAHRTRRTRRNSGISMLAVVALGAGAYALGPARSHGTAPVAPASSGGPAKGDGVAGYMDIATATFSGGLSDPPLDGPPSWDPSWTIPTSMMVTAAGVIAAVDPTHGHLRGEGSQIVAGGAAVPFLHQIGQSVWMPEGGPYHYPGVSSDDKPYGELYLLAYPALKKPAGSDHPSAQSPCGIPVDELPLRPAEQLVWSPCVRRPLPDRSVVESTRAAVSGGGTVTAAFRVFPDNGYYGLVGMDYFVHTHVSGTTPPDGSPLSSGSSEYVGAVVKPSPFTDEVLTAALTGPYVEELGK